MTFNQDTFLDPLTADELVDLPELLRGLGLEPKTVRAALQCELTLMGQRCAVLYFYPAERLLAAPQGKPWEREESLRPLWEALFYEEYEKRPRVDQYFYAVGNDAVLDALRESGLLSLVENSQSYARKAMCLASDLPSLLSNTFPVLSDKFRANAKPTLHLLRELHDDLDAVATVTHWVMPAWPTQRPSETDCQRTAALYARIMGRGFTLLWEDAGVTLMNGYSGIRPEFASRGEQSAFVLAWGLAKAAANVEPGMTLGVKALLNNLDLMKQLAALDEMRSFMAAAGVSFVIQTANTSTLRLAQGKFRPIAPAEFR